MRRLIFLVGGFLVVDGFFGCTSDTGTNPYGGGIPDASLAGPGSCGDGILTAPDEQCDGFDFGTDTCASRTAGTRPNGSLTCTAACTIDDTFCTAAMVTATGGTPGAGGTTGAGGTPGAGGATPACDPAFCPSMMGASCCMPSGQCGVMAGTGCTQIGTDGGGGMGP